MPLQIYFAVLNYYIAQQCYSYDAYFNFYQSNLYQQKQIKQETTSP